jgi:DNA invertase Pin-like site-specific DNA recombinase
MRKRSITKPSSQKPKAYSYVRFSTPEQSKGHSFLRQTEAAIRYAEKHDLELDTSVTFHDLGVSAFKGKNAETGALAAFLGAVSAGHIPEGSYLLVESLDRISRGSILQAQTIFMQIVMAGITLVTLGDQREYSEERLNANPTDFLISLLVMMRGNDESATKARRLKAAWANKRTKAAEMKLFTKLVPGWVRVTPESTLEAIPERAAIVERIYRLFLDGIGKEGIAKLLNAEGVEPWGAGNRKGKHWHASYVTKILDNPAVLGTLTTRTVEVERGREVIREAQRIEGYYPRVIDDETFARVRAVRDNTAGVTRTKGKTPAKNLLAGLSLCPTCGGSMIRVNKGSNGKAGKPYLVCAKAKVGAGCMYKAVGLENVEWAIRHPSSYAELSEALLSERGAATLKKEVKSLDAATLALTEELEHVTDAIAKQGDSPALRRKLRELQAELEETEEKLKDKRVQLFTQTHAMRRARIEELKGLLEGADVAKANLALRELLQSVVINYKTGHLECTSKAGTRIDLMYQWVESEQENQAA